ncbi:MAG: carbohydrate ABC transporter permease [Eubacteriales bacterium]|nr:carbohydrate ABC transporter permease [Eubacteriales bacterium]
MVSNTKLPASGATFFNYTRRKHLANLLRAVCVVLVTLLFISPLYISLIYSLKTPQEMGTSAPLSLPSSFYLGNYSDVVVKNDLFRTGFTNSLISTLCIVAVLTVITPMACYVLARSNRKVYAAAYYIFMTGILIPFQCIMFPEYINLKAVGLINTLQGYIIVRAGFQIGICIMIITNFVKTVPVELEEAANIDGASVFRTFWRIVFPLLKPINVTMLVINTLNAWNDYAVSVAILQSEDKRTLPLAQLVYTSETGVDVNLAFAFFSLCIIPVLLLYLFTQKYIVGGIMSGAVKG